MNKRTEKINSLRNDLINAGIAYELGKSWKKVLKRASYRCIGRDAGFLKNTINLSTDRFDNVIGLMVSRSRYSGFTGRSSPLN